MSVLSQLTARVAARPLPAPPVQAVIAPADEDEGEGVSLGYAEGQSFRAAHRNLAHGSRRQRAGDGDGSRRAAGDGYKPRLTCGGSAVLEGG